jgi:hypothetical protein
VFSLGKWYYELYNPFLLFIKAGFSYKKQIHSSFQNKYIRESIGTKSEQSGITLINFVVEAEDSNYLAACWGSI